MPSRTPHIRLRMMKYAPEFKYVQGRNHHLANACYRAPVDKPSFEDQVVIEEVEEYIQSVFPPNLAGSKLREAQQKDEACHGIL